MAAQNQIRFESINPIAQKSIPQQLFSRPTDPSAFRRLMMTPNPSADTRGRLAGQQIFQLSARYRSVPPGASGHAGIAEQCTFSIHKETFRTAQQKPFGKQFIRRVPAIAIMVAGTDNPSLSAQARSAGVLDFVVMDPRLEYLITLPERIRKVVCDSAD